MQTVCDKDNLMQNQDLLQNQFELVLKDHNLRKTTVRQQLFDILLKINQPLSIQDIVKKVSNAHFVSVYRSIDALHKAGVVVQVPQGFKNLYELSDLFKPHHHHISCEKCGNLSKINDKEIEALIEKISLESGYKSTKHHLELYGVCQNCQA